MKHNVLVALTSLTFGVAVSGDAFAQESHRFKSEAKKLKVMRQVMATGTFHYRGDDREPEYCRQFRNELSAGKIKAIEPYLRVESMNDPRIEPWQGCGPEAHSGDDALPTDYYLGLEFLGGPPFRFYRLELDGDKTNGKEDVVSVSPGEIRGGNAYHWVDLHQCLIRGGNGVRGKSPLDGPDRAGRYRLNVLAKYQGEPISFELFDDRIGKKEGDACYSAAIAVLGISQHKKPWCSWQCEPFVHKNRPTNPK